MEQYCAEFDAVDRVKSVIVCDNADWAVARLGGVWLFCGEYLPALGDTREEVMRNKSGVV